MAFWCAGGTTGKFRGLTFILWGSRVCAPSLMAIHPVVEIFQSVPKTDCLANIKNVSVGNSMTPSFQKQNVLVVGYISCFCPLYFILYHALHLVVICIFIVSYVFLAILPVNELYVTSTWTMNKTWKNSNEKCMCDNSTWTTMPYI